MERSRDRSRCVVRLRPLMPAGLLATLALLAAANVYAANSAERWQFFAEEAQIGQALLDLAQSHRPELTALRNVQLLDVRTGERKPGMTVVVSEGQILRVGPDRKTSIPKGAHVVDAKNRVLMPGLADMHVHTLVSYSQLLLELAEGVTSVRDMDGFPWLLALRERVRDRTILGPNEYVAGQILNFYPMDWYARVVKTPQEARAAVDEQARDGYDFIKVHNSMPMGMYKAIAEEAHRMGLDLVGHIPHDVLVADAVAAGQRTLEHMKGFYLDSSLKPSSEDWLTVMRAAKGVYVCPTFYANRDSFRGEEAKRLLAAPEMRYVPWRTRQRWQALADQEPDENTKLQQALLPMTLKMSEELRKIGTPFLAGTDSGSGYAFHVPGFSLHEELRYFRQAGFTPLETLRTATVNAAAAMRKEAEFGTIEPGRRADLLLLSDDPSKDIDNVDRVEAVMVAGVWLDRSTLDAILASLEHLYAQSDHPASIPDAQARSALVSKYRSLRTRGLPLKDRDLEELCRLLDDSGDREASDEVWSWRLSSGR